MLLGFDLTEIARIETSLQNSRFTEKVFSDSEREYALKKARPAESFAAFFAAKEAFGKAVGTGLSGFSLREVGVGHDEKGKPYLVLSGRAAELAEGYSFTVSLSHTDTAAGAVVIGF